VSETITAIATAPGIGAVGILRISGPEALGIARALCPGLPQAPASHRARLVAIHDGPGGELLDRGLLLFMRAPASFTGEDVVELQVHGGPANLEQLLDAALRAGARLAEPGEFTRRAFVNGRLDLTQAEAIADLVGARAAGQARLARRHLEGGLSAHIGAARERLAEQLVLVEAALDFSTEEHVWALDEGALDRSLSAQLAALGELLGTYARGRVQREGLRCVIAGRPNAGKSSLLNALLGEDRAIVTPLAGTTRDYLDAELVIDGQLYRLVDTAGLRASADPIEAEGVRRAHERIAEADLVVYLVDGSVPLHPDDAQQLALGTKPTLLLLTKDDLPATVVLPEGMPESVSEPVPIGLLGADATRRARDVVRRGAESFGLLGAGDDVLLARARHRDAVARAIEHLEVARRALVSGRDLELIALDLRLGLDALGEVVGRLTPDDILNRIFGTFCIGK
jgi:tRNA modification GTPase